MSGPPRGIGERLPEAEPYYRIRRCREGDLDDVLKIEEETFPDPYDREIFSSSWHQNQGFLVAEGGSEVLGYVASSGRLRAHILAGGLREPTGGRDRPAADGTRSSVTSEERPERVSLQVRVANSAAIALYRQFSFREEGRLEDTIQTARTLSS